jgi:hypothetical protein
VTGDGDMRIRDYMSDSMLRSSISATTTTSNSGGGGSIVAGGGGGGGGGDGLGKAAKQAAGESPGPSEQQIGDATAAVPLEQLRFQLVMPSSSSSNESGGAAEGEVAMDVIDLRAETIEEKQEWLAALSQVVPRARNFVPTATVTATTATAARAATATTTAVSVRTSKGERGGQKTL